MVEEKIKNGKKYFVCEKCGLAYNKKVGKRMPKLV
jgi:predicted ATP-dependent serine protease